MKKFFISFSALFLPSFIARVVLRICGCKIGKKVKIGFNILLVNDLVMLDNARIGHFNFVKIGRLEMKEGAYINHFNYLKGPFDVLLEKRGAIGKNNIIRRSSLGITYGKSLLHMGELSKITSFHFIDLTRSISFGDFSTLAGIRSQLWTHGYVHAEAGPDRFRVDGEIKVGHNVYVGSGVIINPGIEIGNAVIVGGGVTVAKSILEKGMYVSQPLRYIPKGYDDFLGSLKKVEGYDLVEKVYEK